MIWCFCRQCGYRGEFNIGTNEEVPCPKCHDSGRPESNMKKQDVDWMKNLNTELGKGGA